jgi:hypothetical protein
MWKKGIVGLESLRPYEYPLSGVHHLSHDHGRAHPTWVLFPTPVVIVVWHTFSIVADFFLGIYVGRIFTWLCTTDIA